MSISLFQAFLMGILYYLGSIGTPWLSLLGSYSIMAKPLIGGTLVGLIMGDPVMGCIYGSAINLPYIAFISAGGTAPQDPSLAGILGTALAISAKVEPSVAITLALPLGLLGTVIWVAHMTIDVFFVHLADKAAENNDLDKICFYHVIPPQVVMAVMCIIPVTLGAYFGSDAVAGVINAMKGTPLHCLEVIGGLLPALGIALNLRSIGRPGTLLFFMVGFIFVVYMKLPVIAVAVLAAVIAYFYSNIGQINTTTVVEASNKLDAEEEDF